MRQREPTLIGVAPAAPIVIGRPSSNTMQAAEEVGEAPVSEPQASQEAPTSGTRPRHEDVAKDVEKEVVKAVAKRAPVAVAPAEPQGPKHTFDAISLGEAPAPVHRRNRTATVVVTLLVAVAVAVLVVVGKRTLAKGEPPVARAAPTTEVAPSASFLADLPLASESPNVTTPPLITAEGTASKHSKSPQSASHARSKHKPHTPTPTSQ